MIKPACHKTAHSVRKLVESTLRISLSRKFREYPGSRTRHHRPPIPPEPGQVFGHHGVKTASHRFKVIMTLLDRKVRYFDRIRAPCQFLVRKNLGRGYPD